ncbi:MAG: DbpA RNA binding domain-containing protein, partial [Enterobacteriaceae bacterium]
SRYIGHIKLFASHSTIELPKGMPGDLLQHFTRTRILNKPMKMQLLGSAESMQGQYRHEGQGERRRFSRNSGGRSSQSR